MQMFEKFSSSLSLENSAQTDHSGGSQRLRTLQQAADSASTVAGTLRVPSAEFCNPNVLAFLFFTRYEMK